MRFSAVGLLGGLAASVAAEDLLFLAGMQYKEYDEAIALGYSVKTVTGAEWAALTTEDFSKFRAIILPDPSCGSLSQIKFFEDSRDTWSPAVTGNIILTGSDPSFHFSTGGARILIDNSINFAASAKDALGNPMTGLYFSLSCYYSGGPPAHVAALDRIGDFTVRGDIGCFDKVHLVASSEALTSLDDAAVSYWGCSVHEVFTSYPSVGKNGFQALAIAQDVMSDGTQEFGDGTIGIPYILSRGATPAKCGDGVLDASLGEECDDGNVINGDGCSLSCKCESGLPRGDGTCAPEVVSSSSEISSSTAVSSEPASSTEAVISTETASSTEVPISTETVSSTEVVTSTETASSTEVPISTETVSSTEVPISTETASSTEVVISTETASSTEAALSSEIASSTGTAPPISTPSPTLSPSYGFESNTSSIYPTGTGSYTVSSSGRPMSNFTRSYGDESSTLYPTASSTSEYSVESSSYADGYHASYSVIAPAHTSYGASFSRSSYPAGHPHSGYNAAKPTSSVYPNGHSHTTSYTPPAYATPSCPTGPKIIGVEYIVEATYTDSSYLPHHTSVRPIYNAPTPKLPCYICAIESEHVTYATTDFVTVTTTTVKATDAPSTYFAPVVKACETCEVHTMTATEAIGGAHTEYPGIPYVAPKPHVHKSKQAAGYTASASVPPVVYVASTGFAKYPVVSAMPTKTGGYYPAKTSAMVEFTGAAVAGGAKVAGLVGGVFVAVVGML